MDWKCYYLFFLKIYYILFNKYFSYLLSLSRVNESHASRVFAESELCNIDPNPKTNLKKTLGLT